MTNTRTKIGVILAAVLMLFAGLAATNGTATAKQATTSDKCYEKVTQYKYVKYTQTKSREGERQNRNQEWNWSEWSAYSSWEKWGDGTTHLTWDNSNVEALNSPAEHGHWYDESDNHKHIIEYYRQWQLRNTGDTRVVNGQEIPCPTLPPTTTEAPTTTTVVTTTTEAPTTTTEAPTTTKPDKKVLICHRDQGKPEWKVIEISESALPAHLSHQWGEDIYPVPAEGCPVPPTEPPTTSTTTLPPTTTGAPTTTTPEQPQDKVTVGEWTDGKFECGDTTVQQYRTTTTTPYVLVDGQWVLSETSTVTYEYRTRQLTADEQYACPTEPPTTEPPTTRPSTVPPTVPVQPTFVWGSACGVFVGTAVNDSSVNATYKFYADGALDKTVTVLPGQKYVYEKRFNEDTGVHTVQVDWPGDNMGTTVASDCKPPATTVAKAAPLPNTGSNTPALLLIGGALLALGIAATRFRRIKSA